MRRELLIGCGSQREKRLHVRGFEEWTNLFTLDNNADHHPDIVWDLERLPLPFDGDSFDELHAYEVLEHLRSPGDWKGFFADFSEYWRILKPDGLLMASVPMWNSVWAWGDPSHRRVINSGTLSFLDQAIYTRDIGKNPMSDFRFIYKADFDCAFLQENVGESMMFILRAIKPSRIAEAR